MMPIGFDFFSIFSVIFVIMFLLVMGIFVVSIGQSIRQWNRNNHSPKLTVPAVIVAKRTNVTRRHHDNHHHASTSYYATFQVDSGDRMELQMSGAEYGLLVEGDRGNLTFQGTRYLSFERM